MPIDLLSSAGASMSRSSISTRCSISRWCLKTSWSSYSLTALSNRFSIRAASVVPNDSICVGIWIRSMSSWKATFGLISSMRLSVVVDMKGRGAQVCTRRLISPFLRTSDFS